MKRERRRIGRLSRQIVDAVHSGEPMKVMAAFAIALGQFPDEPRLYRWRADYYCKHGFYAMAVKDYSRCIEKGNTDPHVWVSRGRAHLHLENLDHAIADFTSALEGSHKLSDAYLLRAEVFFKKGERKLGQTDIESFHSAQAKSDALALNSALASAESAQPSA